MLDLDWYMGACVFDALSFGAILFNGSVPVTYNDDSGNAQNIPNRMTALTPRLAVPDYLATSDCSIVDSARIINYNKPKTGTLWSNPEPAIFVDPNTNIVYSDALPYPKQVFVFDTDTTVVPNGDGTISYDVKDATDLTYACNLDGNGNVASCYATDPFLKGLDTPLGYQNLPFLNGEKGEAKWTKNLITGAEGFTAQLPIQLVNIPEAALAPCNVLCNNGICADLSLTGMTCLYLEQGANGTVIGDALTCNQTGLTYAMVGGFVCYQNTNSIFTEAISTFLNSTEGFGTKAIDDALNAAEALANQAATTAQKTQLATVALQLQVKNLQKQLGDVLLEVQTTQGAQIQFVQALGGALGLDLGGLGDFFTTLGTGFIEAGQAIGQGIETAINDALGILGTGLNLLGFLLSLIPYLFFIAIAVGACYAYGVYSDYRDKQDQKKQVRDVNTQQQVGFARMQGNRPPSALRQRLELALRHTAETRECRSLSPIEWNPCRSIRLCMADLRRDDMFVRFCSARSLIHRSIDEFSCPCPLGPLRLYRTETLRLLVRCRKSAV